MSGADIFAVVVSFNGEATIARTVRALQGRVGRICVIDNGSRSECLDQLRALDGEADIEVLTLGTNMGIGYALNRGVARARELGYTWLLTMDQDSVADSGMIPAYCAAIEANPDLACLSPAIAGRPMGVADVYPVSYAITSGNMVRISALEQVGPYDEGLFIDCVDFDFSLRLRRAGYGIHRVSAAAMRHQLGEPESTSRFAGRFYARHSPMRRYYMYRNHLYLCERYLVRFPGFILKLTVLQALLFVLIGFYDTNPAQSYRAIARGIKDYCLRRRGQCQSDPTAGAAAGVAP